MNVAVAGFGVLLAAAAVTASSQLPDVGARVLLHPWRRAVVAAPPTTCENAVFKGAGVELRAWRCRTSGVRRGTVVYLHGLADNRASAVGVIERFGSRGFDVVAYDSRAHGESQGDVCTYGFLEKEDLRFVLDTIDRGPIVLLGSSLGAAVALQHAARDGRVKAVVAVETFSDLRTVAAERAPVFFTAGAIRRAFELAEHRGGFQIDQVSPVRAAAAIVAPVLLVHGDADHDTPSAHSRRVFDALKGPKRLILVPGATHNTSLRPEVWDAIDRWLERVVHSADGTALGRTAGL